MWPGRHPRRPFLAPRASARLLPSHALALGLVHGPAELLPVSSSAHLALIPWLARWPEHELDPELRKALEVAAHGGTALALLVGGRGLAAGALRQLDARRRAALLLGAVGVPGAVGLALERPIERRLGSPASIAVGLLGGSVAMLLGDRRASTSSLRRRRLDRAGALDGLLLGVAQSAALMPGVSRNGATLAAARARGFSRADAAALSHSVALPVIAGAAALKTFRLCRRPPTPGATAALALAAAGAFSSTLACGALSGPGGRAHGLAPFAVYRGALALLVIRRLRHG